MSEASVAELADLVAREMNSAHLVVAQQEEGRAALEELARRAELAPGGVDYEYLMERSAILATAVGVARLRLLDGDCNAAEEELDGAVEKTDRLLRDMLVVRGATPEQVDLLLGRPPGGSSRG